MSHQDSHVGSVRRNSADLLQALQWLCAGADCSAVRLRGDCTWTPVWLVWTAVCWAWSHESTLTERFLCAQRLIRHLQGDAPKPATSYQAFLKLLLRWTAPLVLALQRVLRQRMAALAPKHWRRHGFVVWGTDGSKIDVPRTISHQQAYAPSRAGTKAHKRNRRRKPHDRAATKKTEQPQLWLTTMFHVGLQLPWDWRIGPADSSERAHALDMLDQLPQNSLLAADAGFVGYDFASAVLTSGCELLVRVGSHVTLLQQLGWVRESQGTVYLWPDKASRRRQPPLVFRLLVVQGPRYPLYLITSVRSPHLLTDAQVADLYRARWGLEVYYRHLKQTFGRRKLRSGAAANARVELEWSLVGLWMLGLYAVRELPPDVPPERLSMARALQAFRRIARDYLHPHERGRGLKHWLGKAVIDVYQRRHKASRDYPRKKNEKPAGPPIIKPATRQQIRHAKQLQQSLKKG
jgi:hypothetical protein